MILEDVKSFIQEYKIVPNKLLGQHFMVDSSIFPKLSSYASLNEKDSVIDIGSGFGFFSFFLSSKCKAVVSVEKDSQLVVILRERLKHLSNVKVIEGDVFEAELPFFNKAVSLPPYYLSSQLVIWLLDKSPDCSILIVQKEFADRLTAKTSSKQYSWLSVSTFQAAEVDLLEEVPRWVFYPEPKVDSVVIRIKPWAIPPFEPKSVHFFRHLTRWLFTQRNKKVSNAISPFLRSELKMKKSEAEERISSLPFLEMRPREMAPEEFGIIADELSS